MKEPDYRGVAALIIAACGAVGIFVIVPMAILVGGTLGEVGSDVVIALGGVLVGSLATYMGMRVDGYLSTDKEVQTPPKTAQEKGEND